jgi:hypothetical protein
MTTTARFSVFCMYVYERKCSLPRSNQTVGDGPANQHYSSSSHLKGWVRQGAPGKLGRDAIWRVCVEVRNDVVECSAKPECTSRIPDDSEFRPEPDSGRGIHPIPSFEFRKTPPLGPDYEIHNFSLRLRSLHHCTYFCSVHSIAPLFSFFLHLRPTAVVVCR